MTTHPKAAPLLKEIEDNIQNKNFDKNNLIEKLSTLLYDAESSLNKLDKDPPLGEAEDGRFIPWSNAKDMIKQYQNTVMTRADTIVSFFVNAKLLVDYLKRDQFGNTDIKKFQFYLANTADSKLTLVIVGTDENRNHILHNTSEVIQHVMPCTYSVCRINEPLF